MPRASTAGSAFYPVVSSAAATVQPPVPAGIARYMYDINARPGGGDMRSQGAFSFFVGHNTCRCLSSSLYLKSTHRKSLRPLSTKIPSQLIYAVLHKASARHGVVPYVATAAVSE